MFQSLKSRTLSLGTVLAVGMAVPCAFPKQPKTTPSGPSVKGSYVFRMGPAKSFSADTPGDPGGLAGAPRQDLLRIGTFSADDSGNLTGHTISNTDTSAGQTWLVTFDWSGKFVVNADGVTGFFSVDTISNMVCTDMTIAHTGPTPHPVAAGGTPATGNVTCPTDIEGHEDYAFVFSTPGGKKFAFMQIDNAGGGAKIFMSGGATLVEGDADSQGDKQDQHGKGH